MDFNFLITVMKKGILEPEQLWQEELSKNYTLTNFFKQIVVPIVVVTAILATLGIVLFGYRVPLTDIIMRPTLMDTVMAFVNSIVMYLVSLVIFGWLSAYIASILGGKFDISRGIVMMFLISIPSLIGRVFVVVPYIGMIVAIAASIYSLVLLYRAPTTFLNLPVENKTKAFVLFLLVGIVVSAILSFTIGRLFGSTMPMPQG